MRRLVVVATTVACLATLTGGVAHAQAPGPGSAAAASPALAATAATAAGAASAAAQPRTVERKKKKKKKGYRVSPGITFNSPLGSKRSKFAILRKIHNAIKKTRKGQTIRIMSWNIQYMSSVNTLLAAQRRGVRLWILMDQENFSKEVPNPPWRRLKAGIKNYNNKKPKAKRSHAKVCKKACRRGNVGAAHAKFFLFSKVRKSRHVVIQGGTNLTLASATNQWNEVYTYVDNPGVYAFTEKIFQEMWKDRTPKQPWASYRDDGGTFDLHFSPQRGNYRAGDDPLEQALARTRCTGVTGRAGAGGRTVIRAAPDVIRGKRGMRVAKLLRARWDQGCNVRMGYTVMGKDVYRLMKRKGPRGPVPIRHLVQDFNGDKEFDRYFHLKVWTINGAIGNDTEAYWAFNGSSNISDYASASDENIGVFRKRKIVRKYQKHISWWYNHPPRSRAVVRSRITGPVDPYRNVDMD